MRYSMCVLYDVHIHSWSAKSEISFIGNEHKLAESLYNIIDYIDSSSYDKETGIHTITLRSNYTGLRWHGQPLFDCRQLFFIPETHPFFNFYQSYGTYERGTRFIKWFVHNSSSLINLVLTATHIINKEDEI